MATAKVHDQYRGGKMFHYKPAEIGEDMNQEKSTPAGRLYELFGGVRKVARALALDDALVSRWNKVGTRGLSGKIPSKYNMAILDLAKEKGIPRTKVEPLLDWHCPCCGIKMVVSKVDPEFWYRRDKK